MRRPEYLTAWLFDRKSTMPIWLIEKYKSRPLPDDKIGHYATAVDGEFWRWFDPAKFNELFAAIASTPSQAFQAEAGRPLVAGTREEIARVIYAHTRQQYRHVPAPERVSFEDAGGISKLVCYEAADAILSLSPAGER